MVERLLKTVALALLLALPAACGKFAEGEPVAIPGGGEAQDGGEKAEEEEKVTDFDFSLTYFYDWSDSTRRISLTLDSGGSGTYALSCAFNHRTTPFPVYNEKGDCIPSGRGIALGRGAVRLLTIGAETETDGGSEDSGGIAAVRNYYVELTLTRGGYTHTRSATLEALEQFIVGEVDTSGEYTRFGVWRPSVGGLTYYTPSGADMKVLLDGEPAEGLKEVTGGGTQTIGPEFSFGGATHRRNFELPRLSAGRHTVMVESSSRNKGLLDGTDYPHSGFMVGYTFTEPQR